MQASNTTTIQDGVRQILPARPDSSYLLQYLIRIQAMYACIPVEAIEALHQLLNISIVQIESVISFYSFLSFDYQGKYRVLFSDNITDRMLGNKNLYEQLTEAVENSDVSIDFTSCTGLCDQGPAMLVNGLAIAKLDSDRIELIANLINNNEPVSNWPKELFKIEDNIRRIDVQLKLKAGDGTGIDNAHKLGAKKVLEVLLDSGLRGRGGAGFYTAKKWQYCKDSQAEKRYVICNADEGEPGTFKDRVLLTSSAHSVIEGMTICAYVIGAQKGFIYLRGEYLHLLEPLNEILNLRRQSNLLGDKINGYNNFNFDIEIHLGAGAYICGEESALIESLEGKRGVPRIRPPFPVTHGYKNQPTVVNNVETFWSVSRILLKGSEWFRKSGTTESSGTRLLSISGDCEKPGIYEYPFGVTLAQIVEDCGGIDTQAVQIAGAAGNTVLARNFDRQMSFEDLPTGGSFIVIGAHRNLLDMLTNFADFFKHESCGFCTPCRVGTTLIADIMHRFCNKQAGSDDVNQLNQISALMLKSCFCGLGCSVPNAFVDVLEQCPELFKNSMASNSGEKYFDLTAATSEFLQITQPESLEEE